MMNRLFRFAAVAPFVFGVAALVAAAPQPAPGPTAPASSEPSTAPPPPPGTSGGHDIVVELSGGRPKVNLAFPAVPGLAALPGTASNAARELEQTMRRDLVRSGIFNVQGPEELAVLTLTGDLQKDADPIRSLGNDMLLQVEVKPEGDRIVLEGRLIDLPTKQNVVGKRYRGTYDLARRIAHTFSDEVVLYLSGRRGIALTTIAFYSDRDADGSEEIYLMDYDGFDQRRVTGHRSLSMSPSWSADGTSVAYVSFFGGNGPALYLAELASGRKSPIVTDGGFNISPSFSSDGRQIAFSRAATGSNIEIFVVNRDGTGLRRLTNSSGIDTNPAFSPNGQEIAFTSNRSGSPQIYVMDREGTNVRRVTFQGEYNDLAAWSPDGTHLAFSTRVDQNRFDVALLDLVSLASQRLTSGQGSNEHPGFSPDGKRIVFSSSRGGKSQIFAMKADGTEVEALTSQGNNFGPAWSGYAH